MSTNGDNGAAGYGERLDQTEAAIVRMRAERDELDRKLSEHEERYRALMLEREKAAGVRRSRLTPKQKSEIIRARGQDFYLSLPW